MALLEHTIDYQILEDQFRDKIILSSQAELCRAAHKALCQIAKSRASTFIITIGKSLLQETNLVNLNLAREVARHTAAVVNPATAQKLQSSSELIFILSACHLVTSSKSLTMPRMFC